MATVRDILGRKGTEVISIGQDAFVLDAARLMNARGVGCVAVMNAGTLCGIFTERDVLRRVVSERRDPATTPIREVMTTSLVTCQADATLEECGAVMTSRRIRHLPVMGPGGLAGLVTIGDLLAFRLDEQATTIQHLHSYIYEGR